MPNGKKVICVLTKNENKQNNWGLRNSSNWYELRIWDTKNGDTKTCRSAIQPSLLSTLINTKLKTFKVKKKM